MQNQLIINDTITALVKELLLENSRNEAINKILAIQDQIPNLATILWYSSATITALLGDLVSYYQLLGRIISRSNSQKIINLLQIFNILAKDDNTKIPFIRSNIPIYIFPYIQLSEKQETWHIAAAALVVFTSLVSDSNPEIIKYLLNADFIPIVRKTLGYNNIKIQTASAYIIAKILCDTDGISTILANSEGVSLLLTIFTNTFIDLSTNFNSGLSEYVVLALSLMLPNQEVQKKFTYIAYKQLENISLSKVDARYRELYNQMKVLVSTHSKNLGLS